MNEDDELSGWGTALLIILAAALGATVGAVIIFGGH